MWNISCFHNEILFCSQGAVGLDGPKGDQVCLLSSNVTPVTEPEFGVKVEQNEICLYFRDLRVLKEHLESMETWWVISYYKADVHATAQCAH